MPIGGIPPEAGGPSPLRNRGAIGAPGDRRDSTPAVAPISAGGAGGDRVLLGSPADSLRTMEIAIERILSGVENRRGEQTSPQAYEAAGRSEFQKAAGIEPREPDLIAARFGVSPQPIRANALSPEDAASRIVQGITGYIFEAWKGERQDVNPETLRQFLKEAQMGVAEGLADTHDILRGLRALSPQVLESLEQIVSLTQQKIDGFFARSSDAASAS